LRGFHSDGEPVLVEEGEGGVRTRRYYTAAGEPFTPIQLLTPKRRAFRARSSTDPLATVPENAELPRQASLDWDNAPGGGDSIFDNTRRWSTDTVVSGPGVNAGSASGAGSNLGDADSGSGEDDFLSQSSEEAGEEAELYSEEEMAAQDPPAPAGGVAAQLRRVDMAIMEAKEDVLPYHNQPVTAEGLNKLCTVAADLKRELQILHVDLAEVAEYQGRRADGSAECRRRLIEFLVAAEAVKAERDAEEAARRERIAERAANAAAAAADAKRPIIARRAVAVCGELAASGAQLRKLIQEPPTSDAEVFEKSEQLKNLEEQQLTAVQASLEVLRLAIDSGMAEECTNLEDAAAVAKNEAAAAKAKLLEWRKSSGFWSDKKSRGPARQDLKMPTFSAGPGAKLTVYEFEKEWGDYCSAMEYSKEERVKYLKLAIQPPTRGDVNALQLEAEIFTYLKENHGNPMMLLSAREQEIRAWPPCSGTAAQQRDWLIRAKAKLESTLQLCQDHDIEVYLHFSGVSREIQHKLPAKMVDSYMEMLKKHVSPAGRVDQEKIIGLQIEFLKEKIVDCTMGVNLEITNQMAGGLTAGQPGGRPGGDAGRGRGAHHASGGGAGGDSGDSKHKKKQQDRKASYKVDNSCVACKQKHSHLFYCEMFIAADVGDRFDMVKQQRACGRCLSMKVRLEGNKKDWFPLHEKYCKTEFACAMGSCQGKKENNQFHIAICKKHAAENKTVQADFIASLDSSLLPSGLSPANISFLHMMPHQMVHLAAATPAQPAAATAAASRSREVLPDVEEVAIFMLQWIPAASGKQRLLAFYDSGCSGAGISGRGVGLLETTAVRPGPTVLDVAGGKSIELPGGDVQFNLDLEGGRQMATLTALEMPEITATFPMVRLTEAWLELQTAATHCCKDWKLPAADDAVGGSPVDLLIGIRYLKYFPVLVFSLPSGLGIYRARFSSASGRQAVLGGPHAAWTRAAEIAGHMSPRAYFTSEARAWYLEQAWVRMDQGRFPATEEYCKRGDQEDYCDSGLCYQVKKRSQAARQEEKEFWLAEAAGTEMLYRCLECRSCPRCKRGPELEEISFREEAEQALIESSVELLVDKKELRASLPFIADPADKLRPNRHIAERVLQTQLDLFRRKPDMKEDAVKSHAKLLTRGHVKSEDQLTAEERAALSTLPGAGYFIPWRIVHNEGSLSTPCRIVFDASSKTPGGDSLNGVLAKGSNRLVKLQNLLAKFRQAAAAVTADISMAYNGTKLKPEYLKFQRYLWKEGLEAANPTQVMYVLTLIYGVKPSGGQTQVSIEKMAGHYLERGEKVIGAEILINEVYVDDVMASRDSIAECYQAASDISEILAIGSMAVKAFTFSGQAPAEEVSADGVHVSVGGYLWRPEADQLLLDVGPPRLGKAKRGKLPEPITGDFGAALSKCFTRRTLSGLVARVFDPLGLATPVTAGLKMDLHDLCSLKLDWDDAVPVELLDKWVQNMHSIQDLKDVYFRRSIIPPNAASCQVDLIVAVDASQFIGVAAIYGRVALKGGGYSCQLMLARSKIMADLTIPRAELKAAVIGATAATVMKSNLRERLGEVLYVTDSTICLHWVNQDDRPLQVAVRNSVIEIRRLSEQKQWFHVDGGQNIADLGTRCAAVADIQFGSEWQRGKDWMAWDREKMPLKSAADVVLSAEEKRAAAVELRARDVRGHNFNVLVDRVADRYGASQYLVDPCRFSWTKAVRILGIVLRFVKRLRAAQPGGGGRLEAASGGERSQAVCAERPSDTSSQAEAPVGPATTVVLCEEEMREAEEYFYRKATEEVKLFAKKSDYTSCSIEKKGILFYSGRLLDNSDVVALEKVMFDLAPASFCVPVVDRYSPVAYSVMVEAHWSAANHLNATTTYRESLKKIYVLKGRDLAQEVRDSCVFCRRFKAKLLEVEMGQIHQSRLTIAPAFTLCQVDLLGPYSAQCEHNHRSTVKVWGVIYKCPASGAVFVNAVSKCDTSSFLQSYTRFAARYCHPKKLFPDEGSQLLKACRDIEISWVDVAYSLNAQHGVGVEFQACPVGGHNFHGMVERSVREVKKLFNTVYRGLKLDLLGYETAFAWISNELNNLPLCLGTRYRDIDHLDLLTPNRLIHGRANKRALSGCCMVEKPSVMLERMNDVFEAWWKAWHEEKLADYVAGPVKHSKSDRPPQEGDIVIFQKDGAEQVLGEPIWRIGRVTNVEESASDGLVRALTIEYRNAAENVFRETRRAARKVAVLHREGDLELVEELNAAARAAERLSASASLYMDQQQAVMREASRCASCAEPFLCQAHFTFFTVKPFVPPEFSQESVAVGPLVAEENCQSQLCAALRIHTDPW